MAKSVSGKDQRMRQRLIQEAARIMVEEGVQDFFLAKRKAADRLGAASTQNMPRNQEIQDAVIEYQRLFRGDAQAAELRRLRENALSAMDFFSAFKPRLVGPVLDGTATPHAEINLHLFPDTVEEVLIFLSDQGVPHEVGERRLRVAKDSYQVYPVVRFIAGDSVVDLLIFTGQGSRQPPLSQVDGQAVARANRDAVSRLLVE